ncbi:MAG TPA: AMP-binding protein [Pseudogracilibacillus sp.]|nr:AMP-binding protein [Pseudogracilibacillus sp.]
MLYSILPSLVTKEERHVQEKSAIFIGNEMYRYEQVDEFAGKLAYQLRERFTLHENDVLAIQSSNTLEYIVTLLACLRIGVSVTPLNPALKEAEIHYQLEHSDAKMFIYEATVAEKAERAVEQLKNDIPRIIFGGTSDAAISFTSLLSAEVASLAPQTVTANTIGLIIYTSGTTGRPKGVLLSHRNMMAMIDMSCHSFQLTNRDRSYLTLPLFHVNAIMFSLLSMFYKDGSVVVRKRFDIDKFLPDIDTFKPTYTSGVPTIYHMLVQLPDGSEDGYNLSSVRFGICGAAPVSKSLFERFEKRFPFILIEGWGLSEGTTASTLNPLDGTRKIGSIGLPIVGQEVRVKDDAGNFLAANEIGELVVKGPNVMEGYLNNEEETERTIQDGWLHTGDLGYYDEDGYLYIVDRKKDLIIRGGMNIYPKQIEEVIHEIRDVVEVAVIGVPDEKYGEEVKAFVALTESSSVTEEDIINYCKEKLANYRCPKEVVILEELPKNSVGKVTKFALKNL